MRCQMKVPQPSTSIRVVVRWSRAKYRRLNGRLAGATESASRFDYASEIASEAIVLIDLITLACITISLGHMLIDPSLGGAKAIVYGVREAVVVDNHDGSATAWAPRQLRRLLRRNIASWYRTLTTNCSQGSSEEIYERSSSDKWPCAVFDWIGRSCHDQHIMIDC